MYVLALGIASATAASRHWLLGLATAAVSAPLFARWLRRKLRVEAAALVNGDHVCEELQPAARVHQAREAANRLELQELADKRLQLEVLLEGMQDGVLGVDAARRVEWTNAEMGRILDNHGLGAVIRLGRSLAHTLRDPALLEFVDSVFEQRTPAVLRTSTLLPGRMFDVNAAPLPNGGVVLVLRDVTRSEALERVQREFVANVSHELRTPLTSVRGYTETLLDSGLVAPEAEPWLQIVLKNVERMSRLTEDLLVLARTEAPDRRLVPRSIPASTLIHDAVRNFEGQARNAAASVFVGETVSTEVLADEIAMQQVLGNLLENAAKYGAPTDGSPARIVLSAENISGDTVLFRIRDFGAGIAMEHHHRIFERFYRIDKARSRETGGTGLGLAIARYLVEENGGSISLESNLGQGAEFRFTLQVAPSSVQEDDPDGIGAERVENGNNMLLPTSVPAKVLG